MVVYKYMKSFAFTFSTIIIIGVLGYGGYRALTSLSSPDSYVSKDTEKLGDLYPISSRSEDGQGSVTTSAAVVTTVPDTQPVPAVPIVKTPVASNSLEASLEAMASAKASFKKGSKGISIGYIQKFMNIYFKKNLKIDNDFGKTLEADIKKFQSQNKISQTGQIGQSTLQVMVMWLKNNPQ